MKVLADLVSDEGSLPGLQTAAFLLCAHMAFSPCMLVDTERERERERENLLFSHHGMQWWWWDPPLMT